MAVILRLIIQLLKALPIAGFTGIGVWSLARAEVDSGALSGAVTGASKVVQGAGQVAQSAGGGIGFAAVAFVALALLGGRR